MKDFNQFLHEKRTIQLQNLAVKAKNILHVGAAGLWYYEWFKENYRYKARHTGVDLNSRPIGLPQDIRWFQKNVSNLDFADDGEFDMVFAGPFIEHIDYRAQCEFLREVNRVLRPGGYFVFDTPNAKITRKYGWYQPEHIHELEYSQACALLLLSGFEIESAVGIIPQSLLRNLQVSNEVNGYMKSTDFNAVVMDDSGNAFSDTPEDCFVYWILGRKMSAECDANIEKINELFYRQNSHFMPNYYCSATGKLTDMGDGKAWMLAKQPGAVLFGPYRDYEPGEYRCVFRLKLQGTSPLDKPIAHLDVVAGRECRVLACKEALGRDICTRAAESTKIELVFRIGRGENLQFRVISTGVAAFYADAGIDVIKLK